MCACVRACVCVCVCVRACVRVAVDGRVGLDWLERLKFLPPTVTPSLRLGPPRPGAAEALRPIPVARQTELDSGVCGCHDRHSESEHLPNSDLQSLIFEVAVMWHSDLATSKLKLLSYSPESILTLPEHPVFLALDSIGVRIVFKSNADMLSRSQGPRKPRTAAGQGPAGDYLLQ